MDPLYVKYLDNSPVGIKTHVFVKLKGEFTQHLFTIGDLIGAIKENYPNKLGKVDVDDIS
ncbi:hypothetical protein BC833DRAFT_533284, partial [Globomyces pollinis-pini]